ncbi:uncharacterized protein LOC100200373 isoform X1 [Hydra vulgaris]|uniref:uncharacterized protein LOC100200373 isoform X1 n=1 Tax=Hydra vulgaris TaxID=6087 RepID=UPI001F5F0987|nr:uncharacterized protein LOC100200373 [Hydra vulgaris]
MSKLNCNISNVKTENNEENLSCIGQKQNLYSTPNFDNKNSKKLRIKRYSPIKSSPESISMMIFIARPDILPISANFTTEKVKNKITLDMIRDNISIPIEVSSLQDDDESSVMLHHHSEHNNGSLLDFFSVTVNEAEDIPIEVIKNSGKQSLEIDFTSKITEEEKDPIVVLEKSLSKYDFTCPRQDCKEKFLRLSRLFTHMENCIDKVLLADMKSTLIKCPECQHKFCLKDLLSHFSKKHLLLNWYFGQVDQGNWAICQNYKCGKYMDQVDDIVEHFRSCDYLWQCKHCFIEFQSEYKVRKHCCQPTQKEYPEPKKSNKIEQDPCKNKYLAAKIKALQAKLGKKKYKKLNKSTEVVIKKESNKSLDISLNKEQSSEVFSKASDICEVSTNTETNQSYEVSVNEKSNELNQDCTELINIKKSYVLNNQQHTKKPKKKEINTFNKTISKIEDEHICTNNLVEINNILPKEISSEFIGQISHNHTNNLKDINNVIEKEPSFEIVVKNKNFKKKKEKSTISCDTQDDLSRSKTYTLDLDNWSKQFLEFNVVCPIIGCNGSFFLPWQLFKHLKTKCLMTPSLKDATAITDQLESMKFPCLISSCKKYNEVFLLQDFCSHYRTIHMILFKLLYHVSRGTAQCFNYKCGAKIQTSKEALLHYERCKFLWKCGSCSNEYQSLNSSRNHLCNKKVDLKDPLLCLDGKRKKRKSATVAISKLAEIAETKKRKHNSDDGDDYVVDDCIGEDDDFVASSASSDVEEFVENELEDCNEVIRTRGDKSNLKLVYKDNAFYEIWLKENMSDDVLFPEWLPRSDCLKVIPDSEYNQHLPSFSNIRNIEVEYFTDTKKTSTKEFHSAELFKSFPKLKGSDTLGFNAGGPVWGLSWCPSKAEDDQILAVSTHRTHSEHYTIVNMAATPGCIQIWNIGKLNQNISSLPRLSICICHSYGPIYSMEWCPSGCYTVVDEVKRFGLLAVGCGDGKVRILSIPDPSSLIHNEPIFANLEPVITLLPQKLDAIEQIKTGLTLCVSWLPSSGHSKLAAGYGDGGLRIWDLKTSSIFLKTDDQGKPALLPFRYIDAHSYSLRAVAWCPYNTNIIATGSGDKHLKIFDINNPYLPVYCSKRESIFHLEWPKNRIGLFVSSDTCFNVLPGSARYLVLEYFFNLQKCEADSIHLTTRHNAAVLSCSYNNRLDLLATCDIAGEVVVSKDQDKACSKSATAIRKIEPVYRVECTTEKFSDEVIIDSPNEVTDKYIESLDIADLYYKLGPKFEQEFQITQFKFIDSNKFEFSQNRMTNDPDVLRVSKYDNMAATVLEKIEKRAVQRIQWNPNEGCNTWLASGTRMGVVRLHNFKAWASN